MIRNIFKIAFRNLWKDKFYSFINIAGLSVSIAASLLILLYIADELSYDRFHPDADRIYRVAVKGKLGEQESMRVAVSGAPLAEEMQRNIPEVESVTRIIPGVLIFKHQEEIFKETNVLYADSSFFDVLGFPMLEGIASEALKEPYSLVLTQASAARFFGDQALKTGNVIGRLLTSGEDTYKVTGIVNDKPGNSHIDFDMLVSMSTNPDALSPIWINMSYYTYVKLREGATPEMLKDKLSAMVLDKVMPQVIRYMSYPIDDLSRDNVDDNFMFFLQPVTRIHLHSNLLAELDGNSDIQYIYIFSIISVFIILLACINFMNLSTARSAKRAKEVAIRKTLGSDRKSLIIQFFTESFIFILIAMMLALGLTEAFRGPFNNITGRNLPFNVFHDPWIIGVVGLLTLLITFLAGSYPALYLTRFIPVSVLGGSYQAGTKRSLFRNGLVIFQFIISIGLIICTVIVFKQLYYLQHTNLGFDKDNVIILNNAWDVGQYRDALKREFMENDQIVSASYATRLPSDAYNSNAQKAEGDNASDHMVYVSGVDYDFAETLDINIKQGRFFSEDFPSDSTGIVINEAAAYIFGYAGNDCADAIGKKVEMINPDNGGRIIYEVVGVVSNFNFQGLHSQIQPLSLLLYQGTGFLAVRVKPQDTGTALAEMERIWENMVPWLPFEYNFLDEKFEKTFERETRLGILFSVFTILAIIIGCLGIFGLAAFLAEQRTKEIGIRKTMGASTRNVINMLNREFTMLVVVAFIISIPLSWYFMQQWLQIFAYKTTIGVWPFLTGGILAILIAWITVSYQSLKAAVANPVDSLRNE